MADEDKAELNDTRKLEILSELLRVLLRQDWMTNRTTPTVIKENVDFSLAKRLIPGISLSRFEFTSVILPILQDASKSTVRCKDVLPTGVKIKRRYTTKDPESGKPVSRDISVYVSGDYAAGTREKMEFGEAIEDDENEAGDEREKDKDDDEDDE